jgi:hypothetical protein
VQNLIDEITRPHFHPKAPDPKFIQKVRAAMEDEGIVIKTSDR